MTVPPQSSADEGASPSPPHPTRDLFDRIPDAKAEAISSFLDSYNQSADDVKGDSLINLVLDKAMAAAPGLMEILGDVGSHAPLVGVVFSVLKVAGKHIADSRETRQSYEDLFISLSRTSLIVLAVQEMQRNDGLAFTGPVQSSVDDYWKQLRAFAQLLTDVRGTGYLKRLWDQGPNQAKLLEVKDRIQQAKDGMVVASALSSAGRLEAILSLVKPPPVKPIDEDAYAECLSSYSNDMIHTLDALDGSQRPGLLNLTLSDVFVPQDCRQCDEFVPDVMAIPREVVKLSSSPHLMDISARFEQRRRMSLQPSRPVFEMLCDHSMRYVVILGGPGAGKTSTLRQHALSWAHSSTSARAEAGLSHPGRAEEVCHCDEEARHILAGCLHREWRQCQHAVGHRSPSLSAVLDLASRPRHARRPG